MYLELKYIIQVSYVVSDLTNPPNLPNDFQQNIDKSTSNSVTLEWSYDKAVAGFQLYRYRNFPEGSGTYELAFVPMTAGVYNSQTGLYEFSYEVKGLSPYTTYDYQIQTVRAEKPNNSILSEVIQGKTKSDRGYPDIQLTGDDVKNNTIHIYPDANSTVKATVKNIDDYIVGNTVNLTYQWQMLSKGKWANLGTQKKSTLTFASSGSADQGQYRCLINAVYYESVAGAEKLISAYSDTLTVEYSKRTPVVAVDGNSEPMFKVSKAGDNSVVNVEISLISGHVGHNGAPTGEVTFNAEGRDYSKLFVAELKDAWTQTDGKNISKATYSIPMTSLADGVYEFTAAYGGSRVFKTFEQKALVSIVVGDKVEYKLELEKNEKKVTSFIYGDEIKPIFTKYEGASETQITENVTYQIKSSSGTTAATLVGGRIKTPKVGSYVIIAQLNGKTAAERAFNVEKNL